MVFRRKVKHGSKSGRVIGYPTINLNIGNFKNTFTPGVYACNLIVNKKPLKGALYFGPKLSKKGNVLEVFILDFSKNIYGSFVQLKVGVKIREPMSFNNLEELKKQIEKDLKKVI